MNPENKTVWITGASSGIGQALAIEMARHGAQLLVSARRLERLNKTAEICRKSGGKVEVLPFDLSETENLPDLATEAERLMGKPVDILLNVGGVGMRGTALETEYTVARTILDVDFWSAVELTRAVMPGMIQRKNGQIVVLSGVFGKFGGPRRSFYAAAKHALHGWFESLREETLGSGVEITMLVPGWVKTEISEKALEANGNNHGNMDMGQENGISSEECAKRAMPAIIEGKGEQLIGGIECGGVYLNRLFPSLFKYFLRKRGVG